jgi:DNA-binding LacI/PurR family transcriptional regulator
MASVSADDYAGAKEATEYLLQNGHERIAYLHGRDHTVVPQRIKGYHDALKKAGLKPQRKWLRRLPGKIDYGAQFIEAGHDAMQTWLREDWSALGCTALMAHNDEIAIGAMAALREASIVVPEEVSVIGFDGLQISDYVEPRLTTVEVPLQQIGVRAVEMLRAQIEADAAGGEAEVLPMQLRARESVTPRLGA